MKPEDYVLIMPPMAHRWRMARLLKQLGPDANPLYEVDDGGDHHVRVLPSEIKPAPKFVGEQLVEILVNNTWTQAVYIGMEGFLYTIEIGKKKSWVMYEQIRTPQTAVITSFTITDDPPRPSTGVEFPLTGAITHARDSARMETLKPHTPENFGTLDPPSSMSGLDVLAAEALKAIEKPDPYRDWKDIAGRCVKHRYHTTGTDGAYKTGYVLQAHYAEGVQRWLFLVVTPEGAFDSWNSQDVVPA